MDVNNIAVCPCCSMLARLAYSMADKDEYVCDRHDVKAHKRGCGHTWEYTKYNKYLRELERLENDINYFESYLKRRHVLDNRMVLLIEDKIKELRSLFSTKHSMYKHHYGTVTLILDKAKRELLNHNTSQIRVMIADSEIDCPDLEKFSIK